MFSLLLFLLPLCLQNNNVTSKHLSSCHTHSLLGVVQIWRWYHHDLFSFLYIKSFSNWWSVKTLVRYSKNTNCVWNSKWKCIDETLKHRKLSLIVFSLEMYRLQGALMSLSCTCSCNKLQYCLPPWMTSPATSIVEPLCWTVLVAVDDADCKFLFE